MAAVPLSDPFAEAERAMREAVAPEELRGDPCFGRPLHLQSNPFDQGMGMAHRMLRNAGFTKLPATKEEDAIRRDRDDLAAAVERHLAWLRDAARAPGRIAGFDLTVPIAARQMTRM